MDKTALRHAAYDARKKLTVDERERFSATICSRLRELEAVCRAQVVFSYMAMPEEVELSLLHTWLRTQGKTVAFPVTEKNGTMEAWLPDESLRFTRDRFGIRIPVTETARRIAPLEIDLILTPCAAFDDHCNRLGHGGGFYDRFFQRCPDAIRICIAFESQKLPQIPVASWDVPMHFVVTEQAVYSAR